MGTGGGGFQGLPCQAWTVAKDWFQQVAEELDPILAPLGFSRAQGGPDGHDRTAQVVFCRGYIDDQDDGCVDLVLDMKADPTWRIADVRYWGFTSDRWHLDFIRDGDLADQLRGLARTLPDQLEE